MARLSIHLPDELALRLRAEARDARKSLSRFVRELVTSEFSYRQQRARIYGSWRGPFPEIDDPPPDEPEFHW
ncbi:MAG: ribbon-helix-helix domain-containing protein [Archangium sp.]|nr:ribbon-helix-helix domain-containing protein [Archangium sp.]